MGSYGFVVFCTTLSTGMTFFMVKNLLPGFLSSLSKLITHYQLYQSFISPRGIQVEYAEFFEMI